MQKLLVANQNVEQNQKICQHFTKDNRLRIIGTFDGETTIDKCIALKPNILILGSCFADMNCIEIIDKLSITLADKRNCNIILTAKKNENLQISNTAKIFRTFFDLDNSENFDDLKNAVYELYSCSEYEELSDSEIDTELFIPLKISPSASGAYYLREAIKECYYFPYSDETLIYIFTTIGKSKDLSNEAIRSRIRTSLENLNLYKKEIDHPIMKKFDLEQNITPKDFLEKAVSYFHTEKRKKK